MATGGISCRSASSGHICPVGMNVMRSTRLPGLVIVADDSSHPKSTIPQGKNIMATYIVFTRESTQDQSELDTYQSKVGETFKGHPIKILAAYGPQQVLEGTAPEGVVIVEFPSTAA